MLELKNFLFIEAKICTDTKRFFGNQFVVNSLEKMFPMYRRLNSFQGKNKVSWINDVKVNVQSISFKSQRGTSPPILHINPLTQGGFLQIGTSFHGLRGPTSFDRLPDDCTEGEHDSQCRDAFRPCYEFVPPLRLILIIPLIVSAALIVGYGQGWRTRLVCIPLALLLVLLAGWLLLLGHRYWCDGDGYNQSYGNQEQIFHTLNSVSGSSVVAPGESFPAESSRHGITTQGNMINVPESRFMLSAEYILIGNDSKPHEKRFSPIYQRHLASRQNAFWLQERDSRKRVLSNQWKLIEKASLPVFGFDRYVFQPVKSAVYDGGINEDRWGVPRIFESNGEIIGCAGVLSNWVAGFWYGAQYGGVFGCGNHPSSLDVMTSADLLYQSDKQQHRENSNYGRRKSIQLINPVMSVAGAICCYAIVWVFGWFAVKDLLENGGFLVIFRFVGFLAAMGAALIGTFVFISSQWCLICATGHGDEQQSQGEDFHNNRKIVPQKYLTSNNYWGTVIHMANVLNTDKQIAIIGALAEGSSIRSIERITGVHRDTIMRLGVKIGNGCASVMDSTMRNLPCNRLEMDEIWGIRRKERQERPGR
jgi:hypothetical protein